MGQQASSSLQKSQMLSLYTVAVFDVQLETQPGQPQAAELKPFSVVVETMSVQANNHDLYQEHGSYSLYYRSFTTACTCPAAAAAVRTHYQPTVDHTQTVGVPVVASIPSAAHTSAAVAAGTTFAAAGTVAAGTAAAVAAHCRTAASALVGLQTALGAA